MAILIIIVLHWYLSLFFQTFFHHRYSAHRMFTMSKNWEKIFFLGSFITQGASYLSPYTYGILHRMHHAYADTKDDPHSPMYDPNLMAMMWRTKTIYSNLFYGRTTPEERFTKDLPIWRSFEIFADNWAVRISWILLYTAFYLAFATQWWMWIFLPLHFVMGPFHGAIINWFAHKYGYVNFKMKDTSKNLMPMDIFMLGEGYHNNHHRHASNPNFSTKWYELDPIYPIVMLFNKLKIIKLRRASLPS